MHLMRCTQALQDILVVLALCWTALRPKTSPMLSPLRPDVRTPSPFNTIQYNQQLLPSKNTELNQHLYNTVSTNVTLEASQRCDLLQAIELLH